LARSGPSRSSGARRLLIGLALGGEEVEGLVVHVTIDAGSKREAEVIAAALPGQPKATSWRGYGVVRLRLRHEHEVDGLVPIVENCVSQHKLSWARIRFGDEERTFKGRNGRLAG
jgi:hypothetical protein